MQMNFLLNYVDLRKKIQGIQFWVLKWTWEGLGGKVPLKVSLVLGNLKIKNYDPLKRVCWVKIKL